MMFNRRKSFLIIAFMACILLTDKLYSELPTSQFLNIDPDPKVVAMGDSILTPSDSPAAVITNPALSVNIYRLNLSFSQAILWQEIRYYYSGIVMPTKFGNIGGSFCYLKYGEIKGYTYNAEEYDLPASYDLQAVLNYSFPIRTVMPIKYEYGGVGLNLKFIQNKYAEYSTEAIALDLGGTFKVPLVDGLRVGSVYRNLGSSMKFVTRKNNLPEVFILGLGYKIDKWHNFSVVADMGKYINSSKDYYSYGAEFSPFYCIMLRAGYKNMENYLNSVLRLGIGIDFIGFGLNYAFLPDDNATMSHQIELKIPLGSISDSTVANDHYLNYYFQRAKSKYYERDYIAARQQLEEILTIYPEHNPSKKFLIKIINKLDRLDERKRKNTKKYIDKANILAKKSKFYKAKRLYEYVINIDPENVKALEGLGNVKNKINEIEQKKIKEHNETIIHSSWNKAVDLFQKGEYMEAKENIRNMLSINSEDEQAKRFMEEIDKEISKMSISQANELFIEGTKLFKKGEYTNAKKYFEAVLLAYPSREDVRSLINQCENNMRKAQLKKKEKRLAKEKKAAKKELRSIFAKAINLFENGNYYGALKNFEACERIAKEHSFETEKKETQNYIVSAKSALADQYYQSGALYLKKDRPETAFEEFKKALIYNNNHSLTISEYRKLSKLLSENYYEKGMAHFDKDELEQAEEMLERAVYYNPQNEQARSALERIR